MRVLTFSTLFPNAAQPVNGVFVENRLSHLVQSGEITARVVAPVPWVPQPLVRPGRWDRIAAAPDHEERHGLGVWHPRYPVIPKMGMSVAPLLMYLGVRNTVARLLAAADCDLIDAHYFYPDGVAAALLARQFKKPLVITARGTDLNLIPSFALPRAQIRWAARRADGLITVCHALKQPLISLGIPAESVTVLRNGVDLQAFRPRDRAAARQSLGVSGPVVVSVGLLIERKGHHLVIDAVARMPELTLLIAGDGPERSALTARAASAGLDGRVRFLGEVAHRDLPDIYGAADALVLASSREGWANVLLESMACGTPVVATDVWGSGEAVTCPEAGLLMPQRSPDAIVAALSALLAAPPDRAATRRHAEQFSWDATTTGQLSLFRRIVAGHGHPQRTARMVAA
ncbi:MAG: glycosyltransferase family 4 protein [Alphaproteobacteria bacterium]|nr:glycosyltransferase family 4 protein [Alphaproteobacteria bacterium]